MYEKIKGKAYVSCIKLNGVPILPPLITPQRRKEILRDKQQAIKLELRLKNLQELKEDLNHLKNSHLTPLIIDKSPSSTVTFQDNTHIEALGINDHGAQQSRLPKKSNLSRDIIDVTEYSNSGIKIIYSENESNEYKLNHSSNSKDNETDSSVNKSTGLASSLESNSPEGNSNYKISIPPKPRLIRSNSYTLETPSPILIAHLQNNAGCSKNVSEECSNVDNYIPFENSEFSSINTVYHNIDGNNTVSPNSNSSTTSIPRPITEDVNLGKQKIGYVNEDKSSTIEVFQTDISVQQVTVNTMNNQQLNDNNTNKKETFFSQDAFDFCNPNSQLMQALREIPEHYSAQIIELLKQQKDEQQERLGRFDRFQRKSNDSSPRKGGAPFFMSDSDKSSKENDNFSLSKENYKQSSLFSMSPSQSSNYSLTTSSNTIMPNNSSTPSVKLLDLESESEFDCVSIASKAIPQRSSSELKFPCELSYVDILEQSNRSPGVSRKLFPSKFEIETLNIMKKEWAASVIGAYVKGYLTRRLLRTEKVQTLIDTIKDALICALQLHSADNIDQADVELHRRLIQQVSAACYAFHDIFFALSKREQMLLIAADRQHKEEKSKRPSSAPNSRRSVSSSRSSLKSSNSRLNTPLSSQSQSLTKV